LQPFCKRLEIAGSIRRERPFCGDIDIVAEPSDEPALRARILGSADASSAISGAPAADSRSIIQNGPQNIHVRLTNGLELQVFLARPQSSDLLYTQSSNWGSILLLRTGSREHNIFLTQTARANCAKWEVYRGLVRDAGLPTEKIIASATEEEIFDALHLKFVPPQKREMNHSGPVTPVAPFFKSADRP
jgi:DNA polymerase (family X)